MFRYWKYLKWVFAKNNKGIKAKCGSKELIAFATNCAFLIPISFQPDGVIVQLWYFKLRNIEFKIAMTYGLWHLVAKILELESQSLRQRLMIPLD